MDRLREIANGKGAGRWLVPLLGFLAFSVVVFLVGLALGIFDYRPQDEGYVERVYHPPTGERRF